MEKVWNKFTSSRQKETWKKALQEGPGSLLPVQYYNADVLFTPPDSFQMTIGASATDQVEIVAMAAASQRPYEAFVGKIFQAVRKANVSAVIYIQPEKEAALAVLKRHFPRMQDLWLMGVQPRQVHFTAQLKLYQVYDLGTLRVLLTDAPARLQKDIRRKKILWHVLQKMYRLS